MNDKYKKVRSYVIEIIIFFIVLGVVIALVIVAFLAVVKRNDEYEESRKTKCIQNELFYKENKDYIKQNKKCAIIDNEPYIYNNGNLERAY